MAELVYDEKYPDWYTYVGKAYEPDIGFGTLRTGLPPLDDIVKGVAINAVEFWVYSKGGRMLRTTITREKSTWGVIPTYTWTTRARFYIPAEAGFEPAAIPAIVLAIAEAIISVLPFILIGLVIWANLRTIKEIVHSGPAGQMFIAAIGIAVAAGIGYYIYSKLKAKEKVKA